MLQPLKNKLLIFLFFKLMTERRHAKSKHMQINTFLMLKHFFIGWLGDQDNLFILVHDMYSLLYCTIALPTIQV